MFLLFFPRKFMVDVVIAKMNKKINGMPLAFGEFLRFLGLWLYMSTLRVSGGGTIGV
jgi:hypothetical protein